MNKKSFEHEEEHEKAPEERHQDPDKFDFFDRLVPPDLSFGRANGHRGILSLRQRDRGHFHDGPHEIENGRQNDPEEQQQEMVVEQTLEERRAFRLLSLVGLWS